jgi:hypothetical protein
MPALRVKDRELKERLRTLGKAQAKRDRRAVKAAQREVDVRTDKLKRADEQKGKHQIFWVNLLSAVAGAIIVLVLLDHIEPWKSSVKDSRQAWGWTAVVIYVVYAGIGIIRWGDGGLLSFLRGKDGRLSTSLLQAGLWTVALSTALVYFVFVALYSSDPDGTFDTALGGGNLPEEYLLLLGGPFAAAVVARLTVGAKVADEELQKVEANAKLLDVVADDDEQANLVDAQFLVFNLVALTWFVGALIKAPEALPDIPDLLVGLTSTSALAYIGAKSVASNRPIITSVTKHLEGAGAGEGGIRPGDDVEIRGMNFVPEGAATDELLTKIVVKFGDEATSPRFILDNQGRVESPTNTSIIAEIPDTVKPGEVRVTVVTAAGIEADSRDVTLVEDTPLITALEPPAVKAGESIDVRGRFFIRPGAESEDQPSVRFGSTLVAADPIDPMVLRATVPKHLPKGAVDVSVLAAGGTAWSDPVPLTITKPRRLRR